jgi:pre-mRNA-splicing factor CWC22
MSKDKKKRSRSRSRDRSRDKNKHSKREKETKTSERDVNKNDERNIIKPNEEIPNQQIPNKSIPEDINKVQISEEVKTQQVSESGLLPTSRAGGVYIPPFKLARIYKEINEKNDKCSVDYQRMMWEMLRKSINGIINKVNISNIQNVIYELFNENLLRGKGLLTRAIIKAQMASPNFTHVYASLVAVINTKLPNIVKLIIDRYILQFQKAYKRNNKIVCMGATKMFAHLVNQQVIYDLFAFELLFLFLENPTEDSVEMACDFMIECGALLSDVNSTLTNLVFDRFRGILHEGVIDKRIQYTIETLFAVRRTNFKDHPAIIPELDLVADEDKIIHKARLDSDDLDAQDGLDVFKKDDNYEKNENEWLEIKAEILGANPQEGGEDEQAQEEAEAGVDKSNQIIDYTESDLVNLKRTIYLTIISSIEFQECCHKLLKLNIREGQEMELVNMIIDCCVQERTYLRFYGLLAERFCVINETYKQNFEYQFELQYLKIHRLETNKLRNLAKFFAHLLYTDAIDWEVFKSVKLTEEDTTSSSRIFLKIVLQELAEYLGLEKLNQKFHEPSKQEAFSGLFCKDVPKNTRFCINFFTSIGLGALTERLREFLANAEMMIEQHYKLNPNELDSSSSSSDSDSDNSSDSDSSESSDKSSKS